VLLCACGRAGCREVAHRNTGRRLCGGVRMAERPHLAHGDVSDGCVTSCNRVTGHNHSVRCDHRSLAVALCPGSLGRLLID
jgi:hypothetical protein